MSLIKQLVFVLRNYQKWHLSWKSATCIQFSLLFVNPMVWFVHMRRVPFLLPHVLELGQYQKPPRNSHLVGSGPVDLYTVMKH